LTRPQLLIALGAGCAGLAVALGAFAAHGLKARLGPDLLAIFQTGVQYHFYHSLGLVALGVAAFHLPDSLPLRLSGWLMLAGIAVFCGSLYALALTGERILGAVAPIGGTAFIAAWVLFVVAALRG